MSVCTCGHPPSQHFHNHGHVLACTQVCYCLQYRPADPEGATE